MPLFTAVPGKNYSFEETQIIAGKKTIKNHGRFSIDESVFNQAKDRRDFLASGKVPYKMFAGSDSDRGLNCIHAVLGIIGDSPTGSRRGAQATEAVIDYFLKKDRMKPVDLTTASQVTSPATSGSRNFSINKQKFNKSLNNTHR